MGMNVVPASGGSPIKSIQRGTAAGAGTVVINAVNTSKAMVRSYSRGSTGYAGVAGTVAGRIYKYWGGGTPHGLGGSPYANHQATITDISGGTTDITVKECGAKLTNSTTLTIEGGGCEWEVIEFN